jgi:hypothetical protein
MGGETFSTKARGKTAQEAFATATAVARHEFGHGGYTGTIAEKEEFTMIAVPDGKDPADYADDLIQYDDPRINDKWGPAGCFDLGNGEYLFFGWASA